MNLLGRETTVSNSEQLFFFLKVTFSFKYSIGIEAVEKGTMHACLPTEFDLYNFCSKSELS